MRMDLCANCDSGNLSTEEGFNEREYLGVKVRVFEKWTRCGDCKICTAKQYQRHHNEINLLVRVIDALIQQRSAVRVALKEWSEQSGHDACWYYPELFQRLAVLLQVEVPLALPEISSDEFARGCAKFRRQFYGEEPGRFSA